MREPSSDRIGLAGAAKRGRPIQIERHGLAFGAEVKVVPIVRAGASTLFDVAARWTGPPLPPLPDPGVPVEAADSWVTKDLELARRVASEAADELRGGRVPTLRAIGARISHVD